MVRQPVQTFFTEQEAHSGSKEEQGVQVPASMKRLGESQAVHWV